jgi:hypothetical protein
MRRGTRTPVVQSSFPFVDRKLPQKVGLPCIGLEFFGKHPNADILDIPDKVTEERGQNVRTLGALSAQSGKL